MSPSADGIATAADAAPGRGTRVQTFPSLFKAAPDGAARRSVRCSRRRSRGACGLRPVPARRAAANWSTPADLEVHRTVLTYGGEPEGVATIGTFSCINASSRTASIS